MMDLLLEKLYNSLYSVFEESLRLREKKYNENEELDILKTLFTLSKSQKEIIRLVESSSIEKNVLVYEFSKEIFEECVKRKLIIQGLTINDTKYFIGSYGLFYHYQSHNMSIDEVLKSYDEMKFSTEEIVLKSQEKIWCIFLLLFGADKFESKLDTSKMSHRDLDKYFSFLPLIEENLLMKGIILGKKITWGSGKDTSFRSFITNNVLLPKTGLYYDRPTNNYYLDLSKRKNAIYLLNLILDNYEDIEKIMAYELFRESLRELSNLLLSEISVIPNEINHYIIEELKS
jgi:hypothetical protein